VFSLGLAMAPGMGNFRWSFRWLPLFFLSFALLAAHLLHALRQAEAETTENSWPSRLLSSAGLWTMLFVLVVGGVACYRKVDPSWRTISLMLAFTIICLTWGIVELATRPVTRWRAWVPVAVVLVTSTLSYAGARRHLEYAQWNWKALKAAIEHHPYSRDVRYLSFHTQDELFHPTAIHSALPQYLFPGNMPMLLGVEFINGYSTTYLRGQSVLFGMNHIGVLSGYSLAGMTPQVLLERESAPGGLLELLGVDGVVLTDAWSWFEPKLVANGWRLEKTFGKSRVYHRYTTSARHARVLERAMVTGDRTSALEQLQARKEVNDPWCLLTGCGETKPCVTEFAPATIHPRTLNRGSVTVEVNNPDPVHEALIVFPRPWYPGYQATLNGEPLRVEQLTLLLPAVRVPPGAHGVLCLYYLPTALRYGCYVAAASLAAIAMLLASMLLRGRFRRFGWSS
jgi:hypothetical protein